jgi:opacity protein-like surface antigen
MKHLLAAAAMAALLAAPVWAQTSSGQPESTAPSTSNPAGEAQSGASTPSNMTGKQHRHRGNQASMHNRGSRSSKEETAEELNRQELQQIMQGNAQQPAPGTSGGTMEQSAPATNGGAMQQPAPSTSGGTTQQ